MMRIHIDAQSYERDALLLKTHPLFESMFAAEQNLSTGADNALPRHAWDGHMQSPCHLAGHAGITGGIRNVAVGCYPSFGDATYRLEEFLEVLCVWIGVWIQGGRNSKRPLRNLEIQRSFTIATSTPTHRTHHALLVQAVYSYTPRSSF